MPRKTPPKGDQLEFFVPEVRDVSAKDSRSLMDVAVFRLSKGGRAGQAPLRYEWDDGSEVEVQPSAQGLATVWDYDLVLMAVSHLAEAANRYRRGTGPRPSRGVRLLPADIVQFCRMGRGGRQYDAITSAVDRLSGTTVIQRRVVDDQLVTIRDGLIGNHSRVVSDLQSGRVRSVEIEVPAWAYGAVVDAERPEVLTMHRDYFLLTSGVARFLYRLCRQSAGRGEWQWLFRSLWERSGKTSAFKEFTRNLRAIIAEDALPEYSLREVEGVEGPKLVATYRDVQPPATGWAIDTKSEDDASGSGGR